MIIKFVRHVTRIKENGVAHKALLYLENLKGRDHLGVWA
jgi:hypothetical protein